MSKTTNSASKPQEIAKGIYWIGKRYNKELEVNVYLRVFEGNGTKINMLIDPGPATDFEVISNNLEQILNPGYRIHFSFINHQDPDVGMNAYFFQKHFPTMQIITTEDNWRLIRFFGLNPQRFIAIEKYKSKRVSLKTGHKLIFIPTPYCHFRGACALYDETEQVLFSGDLFAGLSEKSDLYGDESSWDGMKLFHQIYMPANLALKNSVKAIRQINKTPKIIAPQHGGIIRDNLVPYFMEKIENLQVGLDITTNNNLMLESYLNAANEILKTLKYKVNENIVTDVLNTFKSDGTFPEIIVFDKNNRIVGFSIPSEEAMQMLLDRLIVGRDKDDREAMLHSIIDIFSKWNIPTQSFNLDSDNMAEEDEGSLFESEQIAESKIERSAIENIKKLNVRKLLDYLIEHGGGPQYSELITFRTILKIPPEILKKNNAETNEDMQNITVTTDPEFAKYIIHAAESVAGSPIPIESFIE